MNYAELIKSILPQVLLASRLINNPEIAPEVRRRNQEILFQEVGSAVYAKTYDMNAFDMNIEYTKGAGLDNRHYGMAKVASDSISNGTEIDAIISSYLVDTAAKAQGDAFKIALEAGESPTMERSTTGAITCAWCRGKAGKYTDPGPDAFDRHASCDCLIYTSGYKSRNGLLDNYKKPKK